MNAFSPVNVEPAQETPEQAFASVKSLLAGRFYAEGNNIKYLDQEFLAVQPLQLPPNHEIRGEQLYGDISVYFLYQLDAAGERVSAKFLMSTIQPPVAVRRLITGLDRQSFEPLLPRTKAEDKVEQLALA